MCSHQLNQYMRDIPVFCSENFSSTGLEKQAEDYVSCNLPVSLVTDGHTHINTYVKTHGRSGQMA